MKFVLSILIVTAALRAGPLRKENLQAEFESLTAGFDGRVGLCAQDQTGAVCVNEDQRFSLQSVMKLIVAVAVMDAVDHGRWRLDEQVVVHRKDLSLYVQPIAKLITAQSYSTTFGDLVRRAIVDSDSAADGHRRAGMASRVCGPGGTGAGDGRRSRKPEGCIVSEVSNRCA